MGKIYVLLFVGFGWMDGLELRFVVVNDKVVGLEMVVRSERV